MHGPDLDTATRPEHQGHAEREEQHDPEDAILERAALTHRRWRRAAPTARRPRGRNVHGMPDRTKAERILACQPAADEHCAGKLDRRGAARLWRPKLAARLQLTFRLVVQTSNRNARGAHKGGHSGLGDQGRP